MSVPVNQQRHIKRVPAIASDYEWGELIILRHTVSKLIVSWGGGPSIADLLGYTNNDNILPEHIETLKRIAGPNGFVIYKMLCARKS